VHREKVWKPLIYDIFIYTYIIIKNLLDVKGSERQNVKATARVLSSNTTKAILLVGDNNLFNGTGAKKCYKITSNFVQMVSNWFDIHNSNNQFGPLPSFGKDLEF